MASLDSFRTRDVLETGGSRFAIHRLTALGERASRLPFSLRVLLENLLRREDGRSVTKDHVEAVLEWDPKKTPEREIPFMPARVILQDFTGVPCVADLAAMRDAMVGMGGDPKKINPLAPVDLVIDHSVQVDVFGTPGAFRQNVEIEYQRNRERYAFLRWGQQAFASFRVVPPGTGIVHQVNLEYLAPVVATAGRNGEQAAYPDTVLGTDSHTTMINGLGVVGWGVGGIEAEAAMLGQPTVMLVPQVVGFKLTGTLAEGATATDAVLTCTEMLRKKGVVGKFVEFYGSGVAHLAVADRATIANMAPEYGATIGFFPVDGETLAYLRLSGRDDGRVRLAEAYYKAQGLFRTADMPEPVFTDTLELDLGAVVPSLAGPKRPQDRVPLVQMKTSWGRARAEYLGSKGDPKKTVPLEARGEKTAIGHGAVVIAAITSCTNTSNPAVMLGAGLLARKAAARGLRVKPWVKTSLAPGSKVVTRYLQASGTMADLETLGFNLVGYGCTTCIGNSGPLDSGIEEAVTKHDLVTAAVLSGNRNFEARIHQNIKANFLMSPPLVVAFALAGRADIDLTTEPLGKGRDGKAVFLRDVWPTGKEVERALLESVDAATYRRLYADLAAANPLWKEIPAATGTVYAWDAASTYIQQPPFFEGFGKTPAPLSDIRGARALAIFGDSVTTDHISPAGAIKASSPAGAYLQSVGVAPPDFNSYGSRRGNDRVMTRGTFANVRIRNLMVPGVEGGVTRHQPDGEQMFIYDAAMRYERERVPLMIFAGQEYGTGSSRDWAAKGTRLLGVRAVVAQSYERIHRSNLVGMGVLPLQFPDGVNAASLGLDGTETFDLEGLAGGLAPRQETPLAIRRADGTVTKVSLRVRIDTPIETDYYRHGGILPYVLRQLLG
jgi:aconitate hydratase